MAKKYLITKNDSIIQERNDYIAALRIPDGCYTPPNSTDIYRLFGHQKGSIQPIAFKIGQRTIYGMISNEAVKSVRT